MRNMEEDPLNYKQLLVPMIVVGLMDLTGRRPLTGKTGVRVPLGAANVRR